jgi:chromosome segregation ATPase
VENSIKSLIREFKVIKENLQPAIAEMKKIRELDVEFRKFKNDVYSQMKKIDFETRRLTAQKAGKVDTEKVTALERELEHKLAVVNRQIDEYQEKARRASKDELSKIKAMKVEQTVEDTHIVKNLYELDKKHIELHSSNRQMIASLISDFHIFKKDFEQDRLNVERNTKKLEEFDKWFKERDREHTKEMNVRKRHINQIAAEINEARDRDHANAIEIDELRKRTGENRENIAKVLSELSTLNKLIKTKVDNVRLDDTALNFARLDKKITADIGEVKGRMRELERRIVGRREIENMQKEIAVLNTKLLNKGDIDKVQTDIIETFKKEINVLNEKIRNVSQDENAINLLKKEDAALKAEVENCRQSLARLSNIPTKEQFEYMKDVITKLKQDVDTNTDLSHLLKKDLAISIGKIEEVYSLKEPMKSLKNELNSTSSRLNADLESIRRELDRINIKVENTSKLLKDLDKVL